MRFRTPFLNNYSFAVHAKKKTSGLQFDAASVSLHRTSPSPVEGLGMGQSPQFG